MRGARKNNRELPEICNRNRTEWERSYCAQDQALYLDQLAFAGQATGVNVGTLTKNLTDNQVALEQMGL